MTKEGYSENAAQETNAGRCSTGRARSSKQYCDETLTDERGDIEAETVGSRGPCLLVAPKLRVPLPLFRTEQSGSREMVLQMHRTERALQFADLGGESR